jgi:hypothetical protein
MMLWGHRDRGRIPVVGSSVLSADLRRC